MIKADPSLIVKAKQAAGYAAAELIKNQMVVGLGTGSTAAFFIESLGKRCREGLQIKAVASSQQSMNLAERAHIPIVDPSSVISIDITVDGADEIDDSYSMIKGGGGALLREKILAQASLEFVVIVDEFKVVEQIGTYPIPVEISPFAYRTTIYRLEQLGYRGKMRETHNEQLFVTDNGNYIFDLAFTKPIRDPRQEDALLRSVAGVVETGLFFDIASRLIIGHIDGSFTTKTP